VTEMVVALLAQKVKPNPAKPNFAKARFQEAS
jgi:hypothetical protein